MIEEVDAALVELLAGAGLGLLVPPTEGANLFRGKTRPPGEDIPARAVFALGLGGLDNRPLGGTGSSVKVFTARLTVRAEAEDWEAGKHLAIQCLRAVHRAEVPGFAYCLADTPAPLELGEDDQGLPEWVIPVRLGGIIP